ncbi:hypothetical protein [Devosia sp.]|uniref:hypothetical protein n=1 Tax=Devosia sp. TaxID=1871048 RepID=UPI0025E9FD3C|nr:hypothetical protein [Devosia sp.]MCR6636107.1 hypothetical protein [Devosia sp.]
MTTEEEWRRIEAQRAMGRNGAGTGTADNARELEALHEARRLKEAAETWRRHDEAMGKGIPAPDPVGGPETGTRTRTEPKPNIWAIIIPIAVMTGLVWVLSANLILTGGTLVVLVAVCLWVKSGLGALSSMHIEATAWLMGLLLVATSIAAAAYLFAGPEGLLIALAGMAGLVALKALTIFIADMWERFSRSRTGQILLLMLQIGIWAGLLGGIAYAWMVLS